MAFINLRRKKGIYLGGDTRVAFFSLCLSLLPCLFLFSRDFPVFLSSGCCGAKPERGEVERGF